MILENLRKLESPKKSIQAITNAINNMLEVRMFDEGVLHAIRAEHHKEKYSLYDCNLSKSRNRTSLRTHIICGFSSFILGFLPLTLMTHSYLLSVALIVIGYVTAFQFRKKWLMDRLEVMSERKAFKSHSFKIAQGIKYLDSLSISYNEKEIKRSLYKILKTNETISAGEILKLHENLYKAFINNDEIGYLNEDAFDHHFVPEEFRDNDIDDISNSVLDYLTIDETFQSNSETADDIEAKFERLFSAPQQISFEEEISKAELKTAITEASKSRETIKTELISESNESEKPQNTERKAEKNDDKTQKDSAAENNNKEQIIEEALELTEQEGPNLTELLQGNEKQSIKDNIDTETKITNENNLNSEIIEDEDENDDEFNLLALNSEAIKLPNIPGDKEEEVSESDIRDLDDILFATDSKND